MYEHLSPSSARLVSEVIAAADDSPAWGKFWYALGGLLRERAQAEQPSVVKQDVGSQTIGAPIQFGSWKLANERWFGHTVHSSTQTEGPGDGPQ